MKAEKEKRNIYRLKNRIQNYAWGSFDFIDEFLGSESGKELRKETASPKAELWLGDHPRGPSAIRDSSGTLESLIRGNPEGMLGASFSAGSEKRLPFLLKVLSAEKALSIQAHPSLEQARAGFAREEANGPSLDSPERNYKDSNHKPELIYALTPFWAMRGFRPVEEIRKNLEAFGYAPLIRISEELPSSPVKKAAGKKAVENFLKRLTEYLLYLSGEEKETLIRRALESAPPDESPEHYWLHELYRQYGSDSGILAPFYLNLVELRPGEAMFLSSGILHAYLKGSGIELMANSDNVLRGGLTPKHIDKEELLRSLRFEEDRFAKTNSVRKEEGFFRYPVPAEEFCLSVFKAESGSRSFHLDEELPRILLVSEGEFRLSLAGESCRLRKGESVFLPASAGAGLWEGRGESFMAAPGKRGQ